MSATEIINELPKLTEDERGAVFDKLCELSGQAAAFADFAEEAADYGDVSLHDRGISEAQAGDLRARLKTFAEDWERPEASFYDQNPAR